MKQHVPNIITCCNLVCGCVATVSAISGNPAMALVFIILGAGFDFFDGMSARLLNVSSEIGKELDSLADDITFGVAPASIIFYELQVVDYPQMMECLRLVLPYTAYIVAAFSAIRLAKFNLDTRQTTSFIGLPTPANALFWGSLIVGAGAWLETFSWFMPCILIGIIVSSWLLVAEIPMFALKFKHWGIKGNEVRYTFILLSALILLVTVALGIAWENYGICYSGFSIIILIYVLVSIIVGRKNR